MGAIRKIVEVTHLNIRMHHEWCMHEYLDMYVHRYTWKWFLSAIHHLKETVEMSPKDLEKGMAFEKGEMPDKR